MLWDKERTAWITDVDKKLVFKECVFSVPFLYSHNFGLFRCNPFSIVSIEGLKHNSKLSCHRQLCYKRLAHSLPLQYFPCFCEKPTILFYENIPLKTTSMTQYDFSHCRFTLVDPRHISII